MARRDVAGDVSRVRIHGTVSVHWFDLAQFEGVGGVSVKTALITIG
ncbi:Uncharacterised protein [Mycobacteroides abscessus subsp. massiliense]|nr:Uncharacterised protein [Mycobacteroides abscessus subsp. massiliense]